MAARLLLIVVAARAILFSPADAAGDTTQSVRIGRHFAGNPEFDFDSDAAVGTRYFAELSNRSFRVYDKYTGVLLYEDLNLFGDKMGLWKGFDQRLRFDHLSKRWIAMGDSQYHTPTSGFVIAVSATDDPTGDWQGDYAQADLDEVLWADYPMLGFDDAGVYVTADLYPLVGPPDLVKRELYSFPRSDLFAPILSVANLTRLEVDDYNAQTDYLSASIDGVLLQDVGLTAQSSGNYSEDASVKNVIGADGPNATLSSPTLISVDVPGVIIDSTNAQPGTDETLGDYPGALTCVRVGKLLYRVEPDHDQGGIIWTVRDVEANVAVQGGQIADANHTYIDPAINANQNGDVVIAYIRSGPDEFPSAYASVGHAQTDGTLVFDPPLLLQTGTDIYDNTGPEFSSGVARISDFSSSVTIDPYDDTRFWVSNAYCSGRNVASTYITELIVDSEVTAPAQLANISSRDLVLTGDNVLIGGFIITGDAPKKVLLRALGPSLGINGALADPVLALHEPDGTVITNDDWKDTQETEIEATGIPPSDDHESAILATLSPGTYTAVVTGYANGTGIGLVEVYDLDQGSDSVLANISTRGFVGLDDDVLIGGLIVTGQDAQVLLRAIGPELGAKGVAGTLADATLELHDGDGALIAFNDDWKESQQTEIESTNTAPTIDQESAILATLPAANYTAIVRGKNDTVGIALVEAYNITP